MMVSLGVGLSPRQTGSAAEAGYSIKAFNKYFKKQNKNKEAQSALMRSSSAKITRLQAATVLAKAYEVLNPKKVASDDAVEFVRKYRIKDIIDYGYDYEANKNINEHYVELTDEESTWLAKAYIYGLITADEWQEGAHAYFFSPNKKMAKADAQCSIKALKSSKIFSAA